MELKMKFKLLVVYGVVALSGCSSPPVHKLSGYDGPEAMHRKEIVQASRECTRENMRPNVEYVAQKINSGGRVLIPINVHCDPVDPPGGYHAPKYPPGYYPPPPQQSGYYQQPQIQFYGVPGDIAYIHQPTPVSTTPIQNTIIVPATYGNTPPPAGAGRVGTYRF
jgi:hypothetical protein